jgi:hypothetical protein
LKNKTFDCAETEVGDGDTASRGISWFEDNDGWRFSNCACRNEICSLNIPVLGQECQFIKKKGQHLLSFLINWKISVVCFQDPHPTHPPPALANHLNCLKTSIAHRRKCRRRWTMWRVYCLAYEWLKIVLHESVEVLFLKWLQNFSSLPDVRRPYLYRYVHVCVCKLYFIQYNQLIL